MAAQQGAATPDPLGRRLMLGLRSKSSNCGDHGAGPVTEAVWLATQGHWISHSGTGSSVWSLFFTWAGVWGDLGLAGLAAYLSLWWFVWRRICVDALAKFLLLTMFFLGGLFTWMEEPAYVLFVVSLVGLRYQERRTEDARGAMGLTRDTHGSS